MKLQGSFIYQIFYLFDVGLYLALLFLLFVVVVEILGVLLAFFFFFNLASSDNISSRFFYA